MCNKLPNSFVPFMFLNSVIIKLDRKEFRAEFFERFKFKILKFKRPKHFKPSYSNNNVFINDLLQEVKFNKQTKNCKILYTLLYRLITSIRFKNDNLEGHKKHFNLLINIKLMNIIRQF